jgi:hypothetical protein
VIYNTSGEDRLGALASYYGGPDITQGTDANRPRYYDELRKGQIVPHGESGRACWLECGDATVRAMANAESANYTAMGVWEYTGAARSPVWWWGSSGFENPLAISGANLQTRRWTSTTGNSYQTIGNISLLAGPVAWCVFRYYTFLGPAQETWVNGVYLGAEQHTATGPIAASSLLIDDTSATATDKLWSELILFSGVPELSGVSSPHRRMGSVSAIYNGMRARWGV